MGLPTDLAFLRQASKLRLGKFVSWLGCWLISSQQPNYQTNQLLGRYQIYDIGKLKGEG